VAGRIDAQQLGLLHAQVRAGSGASERFIIGTLASLGWAASCAWVLTNLL